MKKEIKIQKLSPSLLTSRFLHLSAHNVNSLHWESFTMPMTCELRDVFRFSAINAPVTMVTALSFDCQMLMDVVNVTNSFVFIVHLNLYLDFIYPS